MKILGSSRSIARKRVVLFWQAQPRSASGTPESPCVSAGSCPPVAERRLHHCRVDAPTAEPYQDCRVRRHRGGVVVRRGPDAGSGSAAGADVRAAGERARARCGRVQPHGADAGDPAGRRPGMPPGRTRAGTSSFSSTVLIAAADLSALRAAGAIPLRYVPDNTVAVSAGPMFDPSRLDPGPLGRRADLVRQDQRGLGSRHLARCSAVSA